MRLAPNASIVSFITDNIIDSHLLQKYVLLQASKSQKDRTCNNMTENFSLKALVGLSDVVSYN